MPEIALCRNPCAACADFTDIELLLLKLARVLDMHQRFADDVLIVRLETAVAERTKKLSKGK